MRTFTSANGIRRHLVALSVLAAAALAVTPASSCTTVCLLEQDRAVVAYNYDFHAPEGLVLVNKRGTRKVSSVRSQRATWTAVHGSVTFNQFGRDNPMTGLNEKGLMVSQMWLDETSIRLRTGVRWSASWSGSSTSSTATPAWPRSSPTWRRCVP
jgi:penicillin V acylase-like amidase (Ntn superfamily)